MHRFKRKKFCNISTWLKNQNETISLHSTDMRQFGVRHTSLNAIWRPNDCSHSLLKTLKHK